MHVSSKAMFTSAEVADLLSKQYDVDVDLEGGEFEFTGDVKAIRRIMRVFYTEDTDTTAKAE